MSDDNEHRPTKRQKNSASNDFPPSNINTAMDLCEDGDVVLLIQGLKGISEPIRVRASSHALSTNSPLFKRSLITVQDGSSNLTPKVMTFPDDDGDVIYLLCCVLHLRNDKLPARLSPESLLRFINVAMRYECIGAVRRSTSPWLDYIYDKRPQTTVSLLQMIEAACVLDDPIFFARFTTRFVLHEPLSCENSSQTISDAGKSRLAMGLSAKKRDAIRLLKADMELVLDPLAESLSENARHNFNGRFKDMVPGSGSDEASACHVDKEGGVLYLSALRDADLWPSTRWPDSVSGILEKFAKFNVPDFDASEICPWCSDVQEKFVKVVEMVQGLHKDRLWGLCLDCWRAGGLIAGDCRYQHLKPLPLPVSVERRPSGGPPPTPCQLLPASNQTQLLMPLPSQASGPISPLAQVGAQTSPTTSQDGQAPSQTGPQASQATQDVQANSSNN